MTRDTPLPLLRADRARLCAELAEVERRLDGALDDRAAALRTRALLRDALSMLDRRIAAKERTQTAKRGQR